MFVTITATCDASRYPYSSGKDKIEISAEGELSALRSMTYGLGEAISSGLSAVIDAQIKALAEPVPAEKE